MIVTVSEIVTVTKIVSVTGSVTEIVTATVTAKKNVGNTEAGHAKKSVTATVTGERCSYKLSACHAIFDGNLIISFSVIKSLIA